MVGLHAAQAGVAAEVDVLGDGEIEWLVLPPGKVADFGGDIHTVAFAVQRLADQFFADAEAVRVGGVEEVDAKVNGGVDGADGLRFFDGTPLSADAPAAHGDGGYLPAGLAQCSITHRVLLSSYADGPVAGAVRPNRRERSG